MDHSKFGGVDQSARSLAVGNGKQKRTLFGSFVRRVMVELESRTHHDVESESVSLIDWSRHASSTQSSFILDEV